MRRDDFGDVLTVIGGEDAASVDGDWFETKDSASGEVLAHVPRGRAADVDADERCTRHASTSGMLSASSATTGRSSTRSQPRS